MEEGRWIGYVTWRNKPAFRSKHGGMRAASFVFVVEVMENMAFAATASNLVTYLLNVMHLSPSHAANTVTNFMGTSCLLPLLGGLLCDAFFATYLVYLTSAFLEFLGLVVLTAQAKFTSLKPPPCKAGEATCEQVSGSKAAVLFIGLYLAALGIGGIKGSLPAHGAEQFDETSAGGRMQRSTFFNYFVFCLTTGGLVAVTFVVWLQDNKGWVWGFGISTITILLSIPVFLAGSAAYRNKIPTGSPITTIVKVLIAGTLNRSSNPSLLSAVVDMEISPAEKDSGKNGEQEPSTPFQLERPSEQFKCLNRAAEGEPAHPVLACSVEELEDTKIVLKLLPIFFSTIVLNCCLAQLSTFSVQQAATMDTRVGGLTIPPASLPVFPIVFVMLTTPAYAHAVVRFARRLTGNEMGISHLQRVGFGLLLSVVAMAAAAGVEVKRKRVSREHDMLDADDPLPVSVFWMALQYLFLGSADMFSLAGLMEFFFSEAPARMRTLATALTWASLSMGYYLSSVLVSVVNRATGSGGSGGWLAGGNLNRYHLERFYWLMCVLSAFNFLNFLFWAMRYEYKQGKEVDLNIAV